MNYKIKNYINKLHEIIDKVDQDSINDAIELISRKVEENKKIITCGNGGSSYTASHYISDWNKSFFLATGKQFKGISLCDNVGLITSFANDVRYEDVFSGQLRNIGNKNDLLIVVSGSGNSKNVVEAIKEAKKIGIESLSIVGYDGGDCAKISDFVIHIPSFDMQICEDIHLIIGHLIMKNICSEAVY